MIKPLVVTVKASISPTDPCDEYGWKVKSFRRHSGVESSEYVLGYDSRTGLVKPASKDLEKRLAAGRAFWLSYRDHGDCEWWLKPDGPVPFSFDRVSLAGVLLWGDTPEDELPAGREARAANASRFLERYTRWCNGYVHDWRVVDQDAGPIDSGREFYDDDYMWRLIEQAAAGRPVILQGEASFMWKYHAPKLKVVPEKQLQFVMREQNDE